MFSQHWPSYVTLGFVFALCLALWSIFHIAQSRTSPFGKAVWIVLVLFVPYLGFLAWLFIGPRSGRT
jgi:hypothetical protein